jgi:molecular chaperone Hsp33
VSDTNTSLSFSVAKLNIRGRIVRLGSTLEQILSAHGYPPTIEKLLTEALVITALLGALLKDAGGQLTLQAQAQGGAVSLLVCDYHNGSLRGYVQHDAEAVKRMPFVPSLQELFGAGSLAVTFDQATTGERYQGIVPLEGLSLAQAIESYFAQSEQIPSLVRIGITGDVAGGLLLQHLAEGEEGRERLHTQLDHPQWEEAASLGGTIKAEELCDPDLPLETLAWRLFSEASEIRVSAQADLKRGCRCDPDHIRTVLARFPADERADMADENGIISVDCAFCAKAFPVSVTEL